MTERGWVPGGVGAPQALRGNEPLLLHPDGACWVIVQGSLALFSVATQNGAPFGARAPLFTVEAGDMLFGLKTDGVDRAVLAVPLEPVRAIFVPPGDVPDLVARADAEVARGVRAWGDRWRATLQFEARPAPPEGEQGSGVAALTSLRGLHQRVQGALATRSTRRTRTDSDRLEASDKSARESGRIAVQKLRDILKTSEPSAPVGDALFQAAFLVAQRVGVSLVPAPASAEGLATREPLRALARASQLRTRRVALRGEWWRQECGPLLGVRKPARPVALLPVAGGYSLSEPGAGVDAVPVTPALAAEIEPEASAFYRPFREGPLGPLDVARFALAGRGKELLAIVGVGILATLLTMLTPIALGVIVDQAIPDADTALLWQLFWALLAAALGAAAYRLASGLLSLRVEMLADASTQAAVWDRLLRLEATFFRRFSVGDLYSRVNAVTRVRELLAGATLRTLLSSVLALLNLGLLVAYSPRLALLACATAGVTVALAASAAFVLIRYEREVEQLRGEIDSALVQLLQAVSKLRVAAAEERAYAFWADRFSRQQNRVREQQRVGELFEFGQVWVRSLSVVVLFAVGASLSGAEGGLKPGSFLAFYVAYGAFLSGLGGLSGLLPTAMSVRVLHERARPILEEAPEVDETKVDPGRLRGALRLEAVSFRYQAEGQQVLQGVSLHAEPGELIALVGPSGGGKSTIVRLLLGFEVPDEGVVQIDGQDMRGLDPQAVRGQLGVVLQHGRLQSGSIYENVAGGRSLSRAEVSQAVARAGLAEDVARMPMGLHTVVGEGGGNLSGGQRQRVLIARALAAEPRVLIFDEATSYLDNRTQAVVTESVAALAVTRVVVAHRLSTVRDADRIYVIDGGRVVEEGTCEELLEAQGLFARLAARQLS